MDIIDIPPSPDGGQPGARFGEMVSVAISIEPPPESGQTREVAAPAAPPKAADELLDADAELAASRESLAAARDRAAAIRLEREGQYAAIRRLEPLMSEPATAGAALAAFDAQEADDVQRWAANTNDEPPPVPDTARRTELAEALKLAEQRASAARAAQRAAETEIRALDTMIAGAKREAGKAACAVLFWAGQPIVDRARATIESLRADVFALVAITNLMLDEADRARREGDAEIDKLFRVKALSFAHSMKFTEPFVVYFEGAFVPGDGRHGAKEMAAARAEWRAFLDSLTKEEKTDAG